MELMRIKKGVASLAIAGTLLGTSAVGVLAAPPASNGPQTAAASSVITDTVTQLGLVNASGIQVGLVNVSKSLNSLQILNNVLNNNDIIDDINVVRVGDITLTDVQVLTDFLNANQIAINDVVGVAVLSGGDLIVFTR